MSSPAGGASAGSAFRGPECAERAPYGHHHTPRHERHWPGRCVERASRQRWRIGRGDSLRAVRRVRRADIAERSVAGLRFGGDWPTGGLRSGNVRPTETSRGIRWRRQPTRLGVGADEEEQATRRETVRLAGGGVLDVDRLERLVAVGSHHLGSEERPDVRPRPTLDQRFVPGQRRCSRSAARRSARSVDS